MVVGGTEAYNPLASPLYTIIVHDARCVQVQDFNTAFTPIQAILAQDNAVWKGGDPDLGLKCVADPQLEFSIIAQSQLKQGTTMLYSNCREEAQSSSF